MKTETFKKLLSSKRGMVIRARSRTVSRVKPASIRLKDADVNRFKGQWVAILDEKIIAHGKNIDKVISQTKGLQQDPKNQVGFHRVPMGDMACY